MLKDYDPIIGYIGYKQQIETWERFKLSCIRFYAKPNSMIYLFGHAKGIGGMLQNIISGCLDIFKSIINAIDSVVKKVAELLDIIAIVNAFICGVLNGLLECIAGLFDFFALLLSLDSKHERDKLLQELEKFYKAFKEQPLEKIKEMLLQAFDALKKRYQKSELENAYHAGEDPVEVILLADGIVAMVRIVKNIPKGFEKLVEWVERKGARLTVVKSAEELAEFVIKNGIRKDIDIASVIRLVQGDRKLVESILLSTKEVIEGKSIVELMKYFKITDPPKPQSLSNYQARIWYSFKKQRMGEIIDRQYSLRAKAQKAFDLRNEYRSATRNYMEDRELAAYLENMEKNMKWEEMLEKAMKNEKVNTIDDAYKYIILKSKSGRDKVDILFKIEN